MQENSREIEDEREKYHHYLCSREWSLLKNAVHDRANGVCERCGQHPVDAVHHLTYERKYAEKLEDLAGWCKHCHDFIHGHALWDPRENESRIPVIDRPNTPMNIEDLLIETFDRVDARLASGTGDAVPTHFTDLDNLTGGLHPSEFTVLAAQPSMGKTALAMNIAENVAILSRVPVLFISLEMSRTELCQRLMCSQASIDGRKFRSGFISAPDRERLLEASSRLAQSPLFIDDTPVRTVAEISAMARRLSEAEGLGLLIVDYLQLIQPENSNLPRQEQVARMSRRLKALARELQIPVVVLSQLNRQVETNGREDHRPRLAHFRESGAIEQDADVVMFVHREEYYHAKQRAEEMGIDGQGVLILAKQRNGPTGDVKLQWSSAYTRFSNYSEKQYEEFSSYGAEF